MLRQRTASSEDREALNVQQQTCKTVSSKMHGHHRKFTVPRACGGNVRTSSLTARLCARRWAWDWVPDPMVHGRLLGLTFPGFPRGVGLRGVGGLDVPLSCAVRAHVQGPCQRVAYISASCGQLLFVWGDMGRPARCVGACAAPRARFVQSWKRRFPHP